MKTPHIVLLSILLFAFPAASSFAVLDTTVDECNRRYGEPVETPYAFEDRGQHRTRYIYRWRGLFVTALFIGDNATIGMILPDLTNRRCAGLSYERNLNWDVDENKMTAAEIESILALNANGSPWKRVRRGWVRSDGEAVVCEFNFTKENASTGQIVRMNALWVFDVEVNPEVAARIKADAPVE
jgi:hypothetical protein